MPEYKFRNTDTGDEWLQWLSISDRTALLEANPHVEQLVHGFPGFVDTVKLGRTKPDDNFKDVLQNIKEKNIRSNINTWR